jgi:hypothetical protein
MRIAILSLLLLASSAEVQAAEVSKVCGKRDAIRAEGEASSLHSWVEVYNSYKNFAHCDDAAIGEGYSDSIARLLSEKWSSAGRLNRLLSRDKGFEGFVIRHIDELMSPEQAEKIRRNADTRCPLHAKRLCKVISDRLRVVSGGESGTTDREPADIRQ